jgi:hypothetical protein
MKSGKQKFLKMNISESFLHRTICKKCKGNPNYYFYSRNPILWYDPRRVINNLEYIKKNNKRFSPEEYSSALDDFRFSTKLNFYNHPVNYKSYRPKLHRVRGQHPILDITEYLTCECGQTAWAFSDVNVDLRNDIKHKKSRIYISKKFMY